MPTKKKLTLRQRMRDAAEKKLDRLVDAMRAAGKHVCDEDKVGLDPSLVMQLASQPEQGKTLRHQLITELANEAEAELEKIYNDQLNLIPDEGKQSEEVSA